MFGAFALLERSLRVDARALSPHLTRIGLLGAIYFSLCYSLTTSFMFGAPGLIFFEGIAYLDATFMTLLGIGFFSNSITEEKEEDTLGLMLMAGISPLGILTGKSGGRLWQSLLLIAVQYPFVILAVTMGGVMHTQVWSVTVALLAYMVFLAGLGLLCSTLAPRSQTASVWMILGLLIYFVVPSVAMSWATSHATWLLSQRGTIPSTTLFWRLIEGIGDICVFLRMGKILTTGFHETVWSIQVITNVLAGLVCVALSWLFFGIATRSPSTEAGSRGLVTRNRQVPLFSAGRTWINPFVWKDFHFVSGGAGMLLVRAVYYGGLGLLALAIENKNDPYAMSWFGSIFLLFWLSVTIDAARVLSRSMQDEVRGQTLASLMMLPCSVNRIVYSKFAGAMLGWLPGPIVGLIFIFVSPTLRVNIEKIFNQQNGVNGLAILTMLILYFALIPHYAAFFALFVRWGAVALAIGMTIGTYFVLMMEISIIVFSARGIGPAATPDLLFGFISFLLFCLCAACHIGVLLRVQALGAK
jgi:ABC-type Na+ efflux pump permease subunit